VVVEVVEVACQRRGRCRRAMSAVPAPVEVFAVVEVEVEVEVGVRKKARRGRRVT
jgi:hypothetical protein